jgi:hypothetical protein
MEVSGSSARGLLTAGAPSLFAVSLLQSGIQYPDWTIFY